MRSRNSAKSRYMYLDRARHKVEGRYLTTLTFPAKIKERGERSKMDIERHFFLEYTKEDKIDCLIEFPSSV